MNRENQTVCQEAKDRQGGREATGRKAYYSTALILVWLMFLNQAIKLIPKLRLRRVHLLRMTWNVYHLGSNIVCLLTFPAPLLLHHLGVPPSISPYPFHSYSPSLPTSIVIPPRSLSYFTYFVPFIFSPLFLSLFLNLSLLFLPMEASVSFTLSFPLSANGSKEGERGRCVGIGTGIL